MVMFITGLTLITLGTHGTAQDLWASALLVSVGWVIASVKRPGK